MEPQLVAFWYRHSVGVPVHVPPPVLALGAQPGATSQASSASELQVGCGPEQEAFQEQPYPAKYTQSGRRVNEGQNVESA
jgi:hypothetical protein